MKSLYIFFFIVVCFMQNAESAAIDETKYQKTATFYRIETAEGELKGFLIGTLHTATGYESFKKMSTDLSSLMSKTKNVFLEIENKYLNNRPTAENALLETIASQETLIDINHLEENAFQQNVLSGIFMWKDKPCLTSWHKYEWCKNHPTLTYYLNFFMSHASLEKSKQNTEENLIEIEKLKIKNLIETSVLEKKFIKRTITVLSDFSHQALFMNERNKAWVEILSKESLPFCAAIGSSHLPGTSGMIALFEEKGYHCKPILTIDDKTKGFICLFLNEFLLQAEKDKTINISSQQTEQVLAFIKDENTETYRWVDNLLRYLKEEKLWDVFSNIEDEKESNIFIQSIIQGNKKLVSLLLAHDFNPENRSHLSIPIPNTENHIENASPLELAIMHSHLSIVKLLLKKKVAITDVALAQGINHKNILIVNSFLEYGIKPNDISMAASFKLAEGGTITIQCSPLFLAIHNMQQDTAQLLLHHGSNPNILVSEEIFGVNSLLSLAIATGQNLTALALIAYGAEPSATDVNLCNLVITNIQVNQSLTILKKIQDITIFQAIKDSCLERIDKPLHKSVKDFAIDTAATAVQLAIIPGPYFAKQILTQTNIVPSYLTLKENS